jgi:hypothetical protein
MVKRLPLSDLAQLVEAEAVLQKQTNLVARAPVEAERDQVLIVLPVLRAQQVRVMAVVRRVFTTVKPCNPVVVVVRGNWVGTVHIPHRTHLVGSAEMDLHLISPVSRRITPAVVAEEHIRVMEPAQTPHHLVETLEAEPLADLEAVALRASA